MKQKRGFVVKGACLFFYVEKVYLVLDQIENFIIYHLGLVAAVFLKWVGPFFIDKKIMTSTLIHGG